MEKLSAYQMFNSINTLILWKLSKLILALNAAIEAARWGKEKDSVVADEVRELANQSSELVTSTRNNKRNNVISIMLKVK